MPNIFISYRRQDSSLFTGRIHDRLEDEFGDRHVFRDMYDIPAGSDFRTILQKEVSRADIFLAIIGPRWVDITDAQGNRRLDHSDDFVRIEVESALNNPDTLVIPVLVDNALMPVEKELPQSLRELCYRNAVQVRNDPDFPRDMEMLVRQIKRSHFTIPKQWTWAALAFAIFLLAGIFIFPFIQRFIKGPPAEVPEASAFSGIPLSTTAPPPTSTFTSTPLTPTPTQVVTAIVPAAGIKPEDIIQFETVWENYVFNGEWFLYELPGNIDPGVDPDTSLNRMIQKLQTTQLADLDWPMLSPNLTAEINLTNTQQTGGVEIKVEKEAGSRILSYIPAKKHVNAVMIHSGLLGFGFNIPIPMTGGGGGYNYYFSPLSLDARSWESRSYKMALNEYDYVTLNPNESVPFEIYINCADPGIYQLEVLLQVSYAGDFSIQTFTSPDLNCPESLTVWNVQSDAINRLDWWKDLQPADRPSLNLVKIGEYVLQEGVYIALP